MQTQIEFNTQVETFTAKINTWAEETANPKAYVAKAPYLTAGQERVAYNTALSAIKKMATAEIAEAIAA